MKVSEADLEAMKRRLAERQEQRRVDADAAEAINLVHNRGRKPIIDTTAVVLEKPKPTVRELADYATTVVPAARALSFGCMAAIALRTICDEWVFLLAFGVITFCCVAVCG